MLTVSLAAKAQRADGGSALAPDQGAQRACVLVAHGGSDGVGRQVGRAQQEGRLIEPDLVDKVDG